MLSDEMDEFNYYMFKVSERLVDYNFPTKILTTNITYFKKCFDEEISPINSLLFLIQVVYGHADILMSHAGLTETWCKNEGIDKDDVVNSVNDTFY